MSITGSLVGYENIKEIRDKKNRSLLSVTGSSKQCTSQNTSISNSIIGSVSSSSINEKNLINSDRKQQRKSRIHLNSLWSIWYGALATLLQGYLAVQGAHRFLGCSLLKWKSEQPTIELNIQLILCCFVFILLPIFLTSALFKVGNLANDGVKLATGTGKCSAEPPDGLEKEANGGTLRTLWTHGGPTSAFLHIITAMCLLIPRLILEARLIENGNLSREHIWRTEMDLMVTHRDRLVVLSFMTSPYQNITDSPNSTVSSYQNQLPFFENTYLIEKFRPDDELDDLYDSHENLEMEEMITTTITTSTKKTTTTTTISTTTQKPTTVPTKYMNNSTTLRIGLTPTSSHVDGETIGNNKKHERVKNHNNRQNGNKNVNNNKKHLNKNENFQRNKSEEHRPKEGQKKDKVHHKKEEKDDGFDVRLELKNEKDIYFDSIIDVEDVTTISNLNKKQKIVATRKDEEKKIKVTPTITSKKSIKDSHIHIVKSEKNTENIISSTPISINSKIIEIRTTPKNISKGKKTKLLSEGVDDFEAVTPEIDHLRKLSTGGVIIEPAALIGTGPVNVSRQTKTLNGFAGILQNLLGTTEIDTSSWSSLPSLEFFNLILAILIWSIRYPAVFWGTSKAFSLVFSLQMVANAIDILLGYCGISVLYKLQIVGQTLPLQAPALLLNAPVTLSLYILSTILVIASSMVLYLYGHGRLSARIRDRSMISVKTADTWIYFAHCASLCFVLALAVVKVPIMHDLSATYRGSLDGAVLAAALGFVIHLFLWIILWLGLTAKRRWSFKLPPLKIISASQPLLVSPRGRNDGAGSTSVEDTIYWPKLTPSSPKLKVTFNEIPSTSTHHDMAEHDGKRNKSCGTTICMPSIAGEIDDGDYATLRGPSGDLLHLSDLGTSCDLADDTSEEGKLLACVRDDSVTYASTRDLEPPIVPTAALPEPYLGLPDKLVSPLAPVTVTVHNTEIHISTTLTPRCLRRADSGVPNEMLTPRSDTTSTESSTSPPDRAPSETSSGVHSGEERDEVVIRARQSYKATIKPPPPAIQEEPFGRSTNMKMSSFNNDPLSSATLPLTRGTPESKVDYSHCSTMPLPIGCHQQYRPQIYSPNTPKPQLHTTLPNGVRYTNQFLRRLPHMKNAESPYGHLGLGSGHHTFSKLLSASIPEDRDSANYSMTSDHDRDIYIHSGQLQIN